MRQGISVEYVRYLTGRNKSGAAYAATVFIFGSLFLCGRICELILMGRI